MGTGYSTKTYKVRLYDRHHERLVRTQEIYRKTVLHYHRILSEEPDLIKQPGFELLRTLETLTVGTKEMKMAGQTPKYPLSIWVTEAGETVFTSDSFIPEVLRDTELRESEMEGSVTSEKKTGKTARMIKIPLYLRRAAINAAVGMAKSYESQQRWQQEGGSKAARPAGCDAAPVFYQGMYRNITEKSVELKVFTGQKWEWTTYPFAGHSMRKMPAGAKILSPTLVLRKREAWLHIPVETEVLDIRTVEERMKSAAYIAAVSVPGNSKATAGSDILAASVLLARDGKVQESCLFYGGKQRDARRRELLERLDKSQRSRMGNQKGRKNPPEENTVLYRDLKALNSFYAHKVSHEILGYCIRQDVKVIVVPNYGDTAKGRKNPYEWIGRAILNDLKYKSFAQGIVVTGVKAYRMAQSNIPFQNPMRDREVRHMGQAQNGQIVQEKDKNTQNVQMGKTQNGQMGQRKKEDESRDSLQNEKAAENAEMVKMTRNAGNCAVMDAIRLGRYFLRLFEDAVGCKVT